MKFPGRRLTKHYFPVTDKVRSSLNEDVKAMGIYVVGIDQLLVDIEIAMEDDQLKNLGLQKGQSQVINDDLAQSIYARSREQGLIRGEFPGGAVGNTLHNYSILSDSSSFTIGCINKSIEVGDYAFKYLCNTSSKVNLSYLQPCTKSMGRALCFVSPDGERTFAISKGCMNDLSQEFIPQELIKNAGSLLLSAYVFRDSSAPIFKSTLLAAKIANEANVPVVFNLGSSGLIKDNIEFIKKFIQTEVTVLAMNDDEALALTGINDPLLALEELLNSVDLVLLTVGAKGLYIGGWVDESQARETKDPLHTKSIVDYNKFEYSRAMKKDECKDPIKNYTHINPFLGGPNQIKNTNGAGDAALAALLHDMTANLYHRNKVPNSTKHNEHYLTYSSLSQISKYANRVSYEVLNQNSPRLVKGLPEKEDNLEEAYWAQ
jgi:inosine kinase